MFRILMALMAASYAGGVFAQSSDPSGVEPWQLGLNESVTPLMDRVIAFHDDLLLPIIIGISVFVLVLMVYIMWRYREGKNPNPSRTTHNTMLEIIWTAVPVLILAVIAVPSFKLLYYTDTIVDADMTVKTTGYQWYWTYEYPDHGNFEFDALITADEDLEDGAPRLLDTDNAMVIPVNKTVRLLVTAGDVLHAWAVPKFGVKIDAVPGRTNETWIKATETGTFYGQCSELCGTGHGYMPIEVKVVTEQEFNEWVSTQARLHQSIHVAGN